MDRIFRPSRPEFQTANFPPLSRRRSQYTLFLIFQVNSQPEEMKNRSVSSGKRKQTISFTERELRSTLFQTILLIAEGLEVDPGELIRKAKRKVTRIRPL